MSLPKIYVITGGTGAQGGATVQALLNTSFPQPIVIRVVTRDPTSSVAQAAVSRSSQLARVEVVKGDLNDINSLKLALAGATGVFSVQAAGPEEVIQGLNLVKAAKECGVRVFVHTSVSMTGKHQSFPRWSADWSYAWYWLSKHEVEEAVRKAHFDSYTILRPALLMDNFKKPHCDLVFPQYAERGVILTISALSTTTIQLIAAEDVGKFAAAAFADPVKFNGLEIELAAEWLTFPQIAQQINSVTGKNVRSEVVAQGDALSAGVRPYLIESEVWWNEVGYSAADVDTAKSYGIPLISFIDWVQMHKNEIISSLP
ncbi:unnamed protein product [Adineta ricciae]|uniref:NmrA-like family domain-containing protein 1 n=1 Tax=Adineta ricciae TaxID=249248 RepID=A0A815IR51_ADIRI|nr:unnamed protein product [Adineta ricciae]